MTMEMHALLREKNTLILRLEDVKRMIHPDPDEIRDLALQAASCERQIAARLLQQNRGQDAAINLVSAASCLVDANQRAEALAVYQQAAPRFSDAPSGSPAPSRTSAPSYTPGRTPTLAAHSTAPPESVFSSSVVKVLWRQHHA